MMALQVQYVPSLSSGASILCIQLKQRMAIVDIRITNPEGLRK